MSVATANSSTARHAESSVPLVDLLNERWSPRSFDPAAVIPETSVTAMLEAARWTASAGNSQSRRFIAGVRGGEIFTAIHDSLLGFNQVWAGNAGALIVGIAVSENAEGEPQRYAEYDLGQSMASLAVQAHAEGLHIHQMGGIDADKLSLAFELPSHFVPMTVTAIGTVAAAHLLGEQAAARETAPRTRLALDEIVLTRD
ncbi:nitroreductase [Subtercola boreus]|uniref:Nitroreductase n=1 Tax=Subtercola boreus TaxID=120213 RepID=A0A3E0VSX0_9MICO|nr:nitroreductase family protein [Subtercola boreus]RFA13114.1 nitroreductase [Subtercola boreus]